MLAAVLPLDAPEDVWPAWPGACTGSPAYTPTPAPADAHALEQAFCSSFACCGCALPSLHALLAHFEAAHPDPRARGIVLPPPPPAAWDEDVDVSAFLRTDFDEPAASPPTAAPSPDSSSFSSASDSDMPTTPTASASPPPTASPRCVSPVALRSPSPAPRARRRPAKRAMLGPRERAYRCPKDGCTKAYMNPGGLKYHVEKGTCVPAGEDPPTPPPRRRGRSGDAA